MTDPVPSITDALRHAGVEWNMRVSPCISSSCSVDTHWNLEAQDPQRVVPDHIWDHIHATTPILVTVNGAFWLPPGDRDD